MKDDDIYKRSPYGSEAAWADAHDASPADFVRITLERLLDAVRTKNPWAFSEAEANFLIRLFMEFWNSEQPYEVRREKMAHRYGLVGEPPPMIVIANLMGLARALRNRRSIGDVSKVLDRIGRSGIPESLTRWIAAQPPASTIKHAAGGHEHLSEEDTVLAPNKGKLSPFVRSALTLVPLEPDAKSERASSVHSPTEAAALTAVALERANAEHERTLAVLASHFMGRGIDCASSMLIDATVEIDGKRLIFEVKSIDQTGLNEVDQVRAALAQLLDYRFRYKDVPGFRSPTLWVVLSRPPRLEWTEAFLHNVGLHLLWIEGDNLRGPDADGICSLCA